MSPTVYKPSLNVHIVWHSGFEEGHVIAARLYRLLSHDPDKPLSSALGIPVFFWTAPAGLAPPEIVLGQADHTVVILLVDEHMLLDDRWREWARRTADLVTRANDAGARDLLLPVPFDRHAHSLGLGPVQFVSLDVLPATRGEAQPVPRDVMIDLRIMAELCRLLQNMPRSTSTDLKLSPEQIYLFISHAKREGGEDDALVMRARIEGAAMNTFFDRVDIASGYDFGREIIENIKRSAMLVMQSDAYASRPWCRREVLTAKEFERPIVVVNRIKAGEDRSFPYLGNVRTIRWTDTNHGEIIAATVREYLRKLYAEGEFDNLGAAGQVPHGTRHLIRPPELIDGLLFRETSGGRATSLVLYPDPPLGTEETDTLRRFFPEIRFATPTTLAGESSLRGRRVGISISESAELAQRGFTELHYLVAMIEVGRHVLARGGTIVASGDLRPTARGGHTHQLFDLVRAHHEAGFESLQRVTNFLAWQSHVGMDRFVELELMKVAELRRLEIPAGIKEMFQLDPSKPLPDAVHLAAAAAPGVEAVDPSVARYVRSRCLSTMREEVNKDIDARVTLGGKLVGYSGMYPGMLEEAYLALRDGKPLYLMGALGGCTRRMIDLLRGSDVAEFTEEYQIAHSPTVRDAAGNDVNPYRNLIDTYRNYAADTRAGHGPIDYAKLTGTLRAAGTKGLARGLNNGLTDDENDELFETNDLGRMVYLVMRGLSNVFADSAPVLDSI